MIGEGGKKKKSSVQDLEDLTSGGRSKGCLCAKAPEGRPAGHREPFASCLAEAPGAAACAARLAPPSIALLPASAALPPRTQRPLFSLSSARQCQQRSPAPPHLLGLWRAEKGKELLLRSPVHPQVDSEEKGREGTHKFWVARRGVGSAV